MKPDEMDVAQWQARQEQPFRRAVAGVMDTSEVGERFHQHVGQLQSIVALLLENRTQQALLAWNSLHLNPELVDIRLMSGGDQVVLVPKDGTPAVLKLDDVIDDLQRMLEQRAVEQP